MAGQDAFVVIAPAGDLILDVSQDKGAHQFSYRVNSNTLRDSSRYFENLLSDRFREGQELSAALEALKLAGHSNLADAPTNALPRIAIVNVGRVSASSIENLVADFLRAVHGYVKSRNNQTGGCNIHCGSTQHRVLPLLPWILLVELTLYPQN